MFIAHQFNEIIYILLYRVFFFLQNQCSLAPQLEINQYNEIIFTLFFLCRQTNVPYGDSPRSVFSEESFGSLEACADRSRHRIRDGHHLHDRRNLLQRLDGYVGYKQGVLGG